MLLITPKHTSIALLDVEKEGQAKDGPGKHRQTEESESDPKCHN